MPCVDLFEAQDESYIDAVLPIGVPVVTVEAGITTPWRAYTGRKGLNIGIDRFGASAPGGTVMLELGINVDNVVARARTLIGA